MLDQQERLERQLTDLERALIPRAGRGGRRNPEDTPEERERLMYELQGIKKRHECIGDITAVHTIYQYEYNGGKQLRRKRAGTMSSRSGRLVETKRVPFPVFSLLIDTGRKMASSIDQIVASAVQSVPTRALEAGISGKQGAELLTCILKNAESSINSRITFPKGTGGIPKDVDVSIEIPMLVGGRAREFTVKLSKGKAEVDLGSESTLRNEKHVEEAANLVKHIEETVDYVTRVINGVKLSVKEA